MMQKQENKIKKILSKSIIKKGIKLILKKVLIYLRKNRTSRDIIKNCLKRTPGLHLYLRNIATKHDYYLISPISTEPIKNTDQPQTAKLIYQNILQERAK
jgi:hypothetical protein